MRRLEANADRAATVLLGTATAALLAAAAGCAGAGITADNPVVGPAPPRMRVAQAEQPPASRAQSSDIVNVGFETSTGEWSDVAARVDGLPIFVADVVEAERPQIEAARAQMPPEVFIEQRDGLVIKKLATHIEQELILAAVKDSLTTEQMDAVQTQLDGLFDEHLEKLKGNFKVNSLAELEARLMAEGMSISQLRRVFDNRQLAGQYLGLKLQKIRPATRAEIMERYEAAAEDYSLPSDVKWQQMWVSYEAHGGRDGALGVLRQAVADLKAGETFDVIVGRYSDGAKKETGGVWDYTLRTSLANAETAEELFTIPPGQVSRPIDTGNAFLLARVIDRRPDRQVPFGEVQDDIAAAISQERRRRMISQTVQELWDQADIKTRYDEDPRWLALMEARQESAIAAAAGGDSG